MRIAAFAMLGAFIIILAGCSATPVLHKQPLHLLDVTTAVNGELVYCEVGGQEAWSCPLPAPKVRSSSGASPAVAVSTAPAPMVVPVSETKTQYVDQVNFAFDSRALTGTAKKKLSAILPALKYGNVIVRGYTDNIGGQPYNDILALERARSVRDYLLFLGLKPDAISSEGSGKCCYLNTNDDELDRMANRRVEIFHQ